MSMESSQYVVVLNQLLHYQDHKKIPYYSEMDNGS